MANLFSNFSFEDVQTELFAHNLLNLVVSTAKKLHKEERSLDVKKIASKIVKNFDGIESTDGTYVDNHKQHCLSRLAIGGCISFNCEKHGNYSFFIDFKNLDSDALTMISFHNGEPVNILLKDVKV